MKVFDDKNNIVYALNNKSTYKAQIGKLKDNSYAAIKPLKNTFIELNELLKSFSHLELRK